jgi:hypothetical protein
MDRRFWICGLVVAVAALLLDFAVHGALLRADYQALVGSGFVRGPDEARAFLPYMIAAHLLIGYGMTWLYRQIEPAGESSLARGLRFGAGFALAATIPGYLIYYAVQPWPAALAHKQMLYGTLVVLVLGMLLGYLHPRRAGVQAPR